MDILNIANIDYEETIKQVIKEVKEEYKDLTIFLSCKIFSSLVSEKLRERHVITRLISTKDLGCNYDHWFSLVKDKEDYYVIDLTYRQFFKEIDERFKELDMDGYQKVDETMLHSYINSICKDIKENDYESLFFRK